MEKGVAFSVSLTKDAVTQRNSNCCPWQNCIFFKSLGAFNEASKLVSMLIENNGKTKQMNAL
jgi:hypothetical protein